MGSNFSDRLVGIRWYRSCRHGHSSSLSKVRTLCQFNIFLNNVIFEEGFLCQKKEWGQNLERLNVERPIFRNLKIANIKITKDSVVLFLNLFFHLLEIILTKIFFFYFSKLLNFENSLIFLIKQFRIFNHFPN